MTKFSERQRLPARRPVSAALVPTVAELLIQQLEEDPGVRKHIRHMRAAAKEKINLLVQMHIWQAAVTLENVQIKQALVDQAAAELVCSKHPFPTASTPFCFAELMICLVRHEADKRGLVSRG